MKVLFIDTVHPILEKKLSEFGYNCDTAYNKEKHEIKEIIKNYEGIIIRSRFNIDRKFIDKASNLKFIARAGSGLENIDVDYAKTKNIQCYNAAEGNKQAVAEHALGMLLTLFNNLRKADAEIRNGKWERESNRGIEIANKTVAIIGYGNNGSCFAKTLKGFGVKILAYDKYLNKYDYKSEMHEIYKKADIVSLHIPLTQETTYLVNNNFINSFQKNFYLINTARGKCVNTRHLISALASGKVKGACLDVLEHENKSFEKLNTNNLELEYLTNCNNVILSPHIAGWTIESHYKISKILLRKITSNSIRSD